MGIDDAILELKNEGFEIRGDGGNYRLAFPKEKSAVWEAFISKHLEMGYWNEYITEHGVVFLFQMEEGIRRYEVCDFSNDEVLALCEELCQCKFESLKQMLKENDYYREILSECW